MPVSLREVLDDPSLAAADPLLLAGESAVSGLVRWVHTSEVFEIADLLRGGELLLIGGVSLATATSVERRRYISELAARGVAGLAIETGQRLPLIPAEMIEDAERLHLPLIELRKVVPFVAVTEAINGRLVNESVRRLQLADRVSHALASALADGADPDELLAVLADVIDADIELISLTGEPIARAVADVERPRSGAVTAPVTTAGVTVATLALYPRPTSDPVMLEASRDRAPEALGLALLRSRPLSHLERYAREFLGLARNGTLPSPRFSQLAQLLNIADHGPWVGVITRLGEHQLHTSGIEEALRRGGRIVISHLHEESYLAVVALGGGPLVARRADLVAALCAAPLPRGMRAVVGPGTRSIDGLGRCLREAETCFDIAGSGVSGPVVDAADLSVERLIAALDRTDIINEFVREQLGDLLDLDARTHGTALDTLATYLRHTGNKTETAQALHIQRQSLYQRLDRIFDVLGGVGPGSARMGSLLIAVELEAARHRRGQT